MPLLFATRSPPSPLQSAAGSCVLLSSAAFLVHRCHCLPALSPAAVVIHCCHLLLPQPPSPLLVSAVSRCPLLSIPFVVRHLILHAAVICCCCCPPLPLSSTAAVFRRRSHNHHSTVSTVSNRLLSSLPIAVRRPITHDLIVCNRCQPPPLLSTIAIPPLILPPTRHWLLCYKSRRTTTTGEWTFGNELNKLTPHIPSTAFSNQIHSNSKKKNTKKEENDGFDWKWTSKEIEAFLVHQQLPPPNLKCALLIVSVLFGYRGFRELVQV